MADSGHYNKVLTGKFTLAKQLICCRSIGFISRDDISPLYAGSEAPSCFTLYLVVFLVRCQYL